MEFAVQWVPEQKDMDYVGMVNKGACRMLLWPHLIRLLANSGRQRNSWIS